MRSLILVTLAASVAACDRSALDPRGVGRNETLLVVTASGRAESRPDEARLQLGVQSDASSAGEASRLNREKMDRVTAALGRLGVRPENFQTRNLSLNRIDHGPERGRYRAYNVVEVTMRDMSKVGDAVTAVTEAGANVLSGPSLRVTDADSANKSAYAMAYRNARSRAEAYAEAADLKIGRVLGIYDGGVVPHSYAMDAMAQEGRGMATIAPTAPPPPPMSAPFSAGTNTSEVRVRVDFALEPS